MELQAQRIAIAEALGKKVKVNGHICDSISVFGTSIWPGTDLGDEHGRMIPHYPTDLNAMQKAIISLGEKDTEFGAHLIEILGITHKQDFDVWRNATVALICRATAEQLAEAFLKTIGKWEETE